MAFFDKLLRAGETRKVRALADLVPDIGALEPELQKLDDHALQHKTVEFRERLDRGEDVDNLLIEAFAVTARPPTGSSVSATTTCSSWAVPRSTSAGSPR